MSTEAATIEAPAKTAPVGETNFGAAFSKAMSGAKPESSSAPERPAAAPEKAQEAKPEPKPEAKAPPKPKSALDALLSGEQITEAPAPTDEDPLKEFPENLDLKARNWAGLRKKADEGWKRAKELEAKLSQPDPKLAEELTGLRASVKEREAALAEMKAKMAEYKDAMTAVNIELDPDYRREFIDGRKALVEGASKRFKDYGGKPEELADVLAMPEGHRRDEAIENLLGELSETGKAKILRAISEVEALDERRNAILAKPQESFEQLQRKHMAEQKQQAEQAESLKQATFEKVSQELAKTIPTLRLADESMDGGKEWNTARAKNNEAALALLGDGLTPEQVVTASIKAADYDRVVTLLMDARKALAEREARLAEFDGAAPDMKGRKAPALTPAEERAKKTPGEIFKEAYSQARTGDDF